MAVSEIAFGNWITHGAQVDNNTAYSCVHAALDAGITTFDTADVYSETRAESVLGQALKDQVDNRIHLDSFLFNIWIHTMLCIKNR